MLMKANSAAVGDCTAVIGTQWGDEGKGKIIDMLAAEYDVIARACGGANAGHTIVVAEKKHVFRLLPSGCLHEHAQIVLGSGMVIHLPTLIEEIDLLRQAGIDIVPRLKISHEAHILFDFHKLLDAANEDHRAKTGKGIGTTRRGIGPAYCDKAARIGIRMERISENLAEDLSARKDTLQRAYGITIDVDAECRCIEESAKIVASSVTDTVAFLSAMRSSRKHILIEGAQATLLDIDHGTYPYVTSSSTTVAGALQGLGLPPQCIGEVIGVAKAYCTRVGAGDFLTEVQGETGERLRERGGEYGSVTKRPRRCGWLFLPDLQRSAMINGCTCLNITKLDVLDTEEVIRIGVGESQGKAVYKDFAGWMCSTAGVASYERLPKNAQVLIECIEMETGVPIRYIGTGQGRGEMIIR